MESLLILMLLFAITLRLVTPQKPNYFFGYQLGSAKKSIEHWKVANKTAANYLITLYSIALILSLIFDYRKYDVGLYILALLFVGLILIYFIIENKLKRIDSDASGNNHLPQQRPDA